MKWACGWIASLLYAQDAAYQIGLHTAPALDVKGVDISRVPGRHSPHNEDVSDYIRQQQQQRLTVDPLTDPIFVQGEGAVADPHKTMGHVIVKDIPAAGNNEFITCEQGGAEYTQRCEKHLEIDIEVRPATYRKEYYCNGHDADNTSRDCFSRQGLSYRPDWVSRYDRGTPRLLEIRDRWNSGPQTTYCRPGCLSRTVVDQPKSVTVTREVWINGCQTLESLADQGLCQCVQSEIGPKETRTIHNEPISRDKWFEKYTYTCLKASANNCGALAARGCVQVASRCKEYIGDVCVLYEQTYRCMKGQRKGASYRVAGEGTFFCLTGNCARDSYEDNTEFAQALSQLTVLNQAQKDLRANIGIFTGQIRACRKHAIGFSDCCTTGGGGWGKSLGLAGCNAEERELAEWRPQKRCVWVGTYCAEREKITGLCLRKKTSFCCFGTQLSRLIQEQGRAQLGIGWGTPDMPNCRGLSPDELSRLDMSRMDLSELFVDVTANFHPPPQDHVAQGVELERIRANMKHLIANLSPSEGQGKP